MTTKVKFNLPAEYVHNASEGVLVGEFNNWNPEEGVRLKKKEDGSMYAEIALAAGQSYQYRYLLNDGRWVNDSSSTVQNDVYGQPVENCLIEVPANVAKEVLSKKVAAPKKQLRQRKSLQLKKWLRQKKKRLQKKPAQVKKLRPKKNQPHQKNFKLASYKLTSFLGGPAFRKLCKNYRLALNIKPSLRGFFL